MKVAVADLKPNPFRNMKHYPIDAEKVTRLAQSIKDTTFWDNILGRKNGDGVQIAYGHHRLRALQKVMRDGTVDIPVRPLSDEQMLKIMANENGEEWGGQTQADLETIRVVRQYMVEHPSSTAWKTASTHQPGPLAIARFLGGIWTEGKVKAVLEIVVPLEKREIDEEAIRAIPTTTEARKFVTEVRRHHLTPSAQRNLAAKIASNKVEAEGIRYEASRHAIRRAPEPDRPKLEFEHHLDAAAKLAVDLNALIHEELLPRKSVLREYAYQSFAGLRDLHALYSTLETLFNVNPAQFSALARRGGSR